MMIPSLAGTDGEGASRVCLPIDFRTRQFSVKDILVVRFASEHERRYV
jgi:hypothetical protein